MTLDEALAWLRGERSTANFWRGAGDGQREVWLAQNDAALTEQAYWIVRAHSESLVVEVTP